MRWWLLTLMLACDVPDPATLDLDGDGATADVDCDDEDAAIGPQVREVCDGIDRDCDGRVDGSPLPFGGATAWAPDRDLDGYGDDEAVAWWCVAPPEGHVDVLGDCNDLVATFHPGATEVCNEIDDDCDGLVDDDDDDRDATTGSLWYQDVDRDGYGDVTRDRRSCRPPGPLYVDVPYDCDDDDDTRNPDAAEACNGVDDNCDGAIDDQLSNSLSPGEGFTRYPDEDRDGYGDDGRVFRTCHPGSFPEAVITGGDCDDRSRIVHPGADELCNDEDDDCDGTVDEDVAADDWILLWPDGDGDGWGDAEADGVRGCDLPGHVDRAEDCDDTRADVHPFLPETCNGIDDDCDGFADDDEPDMIPLLASHFVVDRDEDLWGVQSWSCDGTPPDAVSTASLDGVGDCDDARADVHPGIVDTACDGVRMDCSGAIEWRVPEDVSLTTAPSRTRPGDTVCIGPGTFAGGVTEGSRDVAYWGAGMDRTFIQPPSTSATTFTFPQDGMLSDLTIGGPPQVGDHSTTVVQAMDGFVARRVALRAMTIELRTSEGVIHVEGDADLEGLVLSDLDVTLAGDLPRAEGLIDLTNRQANHRVTDLLVQRVQIDPNGSGVAGSVLRTASASATVQRVTFEDVETRSLDAADLEGGLVAIAALDEGVLEDLTVRGAVVHRGAAIRGGLVSILADGAGTFDLRRLDLRDVDISSPGADGSLLRIRDTSSAPAPAIEVEQLVIAGAHVDTWPGTSHDGVVRLVQGLRDDGIQLTHGTFADIDVTGTTTGTATLFAPDLGLPAVQGLILADVVGPFHLAASLAGTDLSSTALGVGVWTGPLPNAGTTGALTVAGEAGFTAYEAATDPLLFDLHLLPSSPAVDLLDGLLPDDADGSPADAGAYGGPGGDW